MHPGLPDVPLHPTQIYSSLGSFALLGLLVLVYRRKRFHGQIFITYLVVYSVTRFLVEYVRGDAERGFVFGGLMSTSQGVGILLAMLAATSWVLLDRRHRRSNEPDWQPASVQRRGARERR